MPVNAKQKGSRGEREFAQVLKDAGFEARRGVQYQGGTDSPDVIASDGVCHWEVKYTERLLLYDAVEQATSDAPKGKIPVVAHRRTRGQWMAIIPMSEWLHVVKVLKTLNEM